SVAVVGTRRPTDAGRRFAAALAGALVRSEAVVVSGLAIGIDGAAHAATIAEGGQTVAVLGGGHARLYPRSHAALAEAIVASGGALVSELPPGVGPTRWQFPRRNRIISGLAEATVVVEAAPGSGALVTAGWALEQGRECFLVPGPIGARASAGCLAFLREHHGVARIVAGIPELLDDLGFGRRPRRSGRPSRAAILASLGATERAVAAVIVDGTVGVDGIVAATGLPVASVLGAISLLEARGLVGSGYGRYWPIGQLASAAAR
ncbi:MAG TPA: DNA-processing protein DprA, partial [Candidatus Binatia bacterium]|nr:DNA-processing protein DprA [Candidatus Binatia bacterium]